MPSNSSEVLQSTEDFISGDENDTKDTEEVDEDTDDGQNQTGNLSSDANTTGQHKRHRRRKRKLYSEICKQLEFYFSDANITKNRMMHDMVVSTEYVSLETLLEFNKMQKMTSKVKDLQKALPYSDKLILSEDKTGVKRKSAFDPSKLKDEATIEECTIYVENVPKHVDHQWLETIFQVFGPIAYISLPKFRHNGQPKGFAFVEYESPESSSRCLEAYGQQGVGFSGELDPSELQSIQTYEEQQARESKEVSDSDTQTSTEPKEEKESLASNRKRKLKVENDEVDAEKKAKVEIDEEAEEEIKCEEIESELLSRPLASEIVNKKKKRKQNKTKKTTEEKLESDSIKLRVLPKKKWRQLRNRYLNLQRENMAKLKRQLRQSRLMEGYNSYASNETYHQKQNVNPHHKQDTYSHQKQQAYSDYPHQKQNPNTHMQFGTKPKSKIVKINLSTPSESVDVFKKQICVDLAAQGQFDGSNTGNEVVKYVDYNEGGLEAFIRLDADPSVEEFVKEFVQKAGRVFKSVELLSEKEGDEYWQLVKKTHKTKKQNKYNKVTRGRDRLLLAASKSNHVHFDEGDIIADSK